MTTNLSTNVAGNHPSRFGDKRTPRTARLQPPLKSSSASSRRVHSGFQNSWTILIDKTINHRHKVLRNTSIGESILTSSPSALLHSRDSRIDSRGSRVLCKPQDVFRHFRLLT